MHSREITVQAAANSPTRREAGPIGVFVATSTRNDAKTDRVDDPSPANLHGRCTERKPITTMVSESKIGHRSLFSSKKAIMSLWGGGREEMVRKCSDILAVYPTGDNIVEAALSRFNGPPSHSQIMTASPPSNLHRPNELAEDVPLAKGDTRGNCSPDNASSFIDPAKGGAFFGRNVREISPRRSSISRTRGSRVRAR